MSRSGRSSRQLPSAVAKALVGVGWLVAGCLILSIQIRRASRHGTDDYD